MTFLPNSSLLQLIKDKDEKGIEACLESMTTFEVADMIIKNPEDSISIFSGLPARFAANVYNFLPVKIQKKILETLAPAHLASILAVMPSDDCVNILSQLPQTVFDEYVKKLPPESQLQILETLGYPEKSVGRLLTTEYIAVRKNWTVGQAVERIRAQENLDIKLNDVYVLNDEDSVEKVLDIKLFFTYEPEIKIDQLPGKRISPINVLEPIYSVIQKFKHYGYLSMPIVDNNNQMLGVVTIDDILRQATKETTEKIQRIGGLEALDEPYMDTPFVQLVKKRGRWLTLLFVGEMLTATAMGFFEQEISKAVVLALFLPLIISSGGNAGSQSSTLIIRAMALGEIRLRNWWTIMKWEILTGLCLGLLLGAIGFARVTLWSTFSNIYGAHWLLIAITIFLSLTGVVLWGSLIGAMLPFLLRSLKLDPATSSAPLVATLVDVTGIIIYFCIALTILKDTIL